MRAIEAEVDTLKKSVSDGKTAVASAITDKGITTATDAAFATMADNIGQISTLATETADATATAAQVLAGAKAYAKGVPVVGAMPNNGGPSTAIAAGKLKAGYTTGGAITNLAAGNIKKGVAIGGIIGALSTLQVYEGTASTQYGNGTVTDLPFSPKIVIAMLLRNNGSDVSDRKTCGGVYTGFSNTFNEQDSYYPLYSLTIAGNGFTWRATNKNEIEYIAITW